MVEGPFDDFTQEELDEFETLEEAQEAFDDKRNEYNRTPREELGGLSPEQTYDLLHTDWTEPGGVFSLNDSLMDIEARAVRFVKNSIKFLEQVREKNGLPTTNAGNLKRKAVSRFMEILEFDEDRLEDIREYNEVINESDVVRLHILRVVLEVGDLLTEKNGAFTATTKAEDFLDSDNPSEFMVYLFETYFKNFNISYYSRGREWPEIQNTLPFTFYQLSEFDSEWKDENEILDRVTLPVIEEKAEEIDEQFLSLHYSTRVFRPLIRFNLLEKRKIESDTSPVEQTQYRKHSLMDKFFDFDL
jgi:hypothetical protein